MTTTPPYNRTLVQRLFGIVPRSVSEGHKELRFTRTRQATHFFLGSVLFLMLGAGCFIAMLGSWGPADRDFQRCAWLCLIPLLPAFLAYRVGIHCVRHAYILLSPMGVEIFPFFKPEKNLQLVFWSQVADCDITKTRLTLHTNAEKTAGVVVTLKPIAQSQIYLLQKAISSRTASKHTSTN